MAIHHGGRGGCPKEGLEEAQGLGCISTKGSVWFCVSPVSQLFCEPRMAVPTTPQFFLRGLGCIDTIISIIWLLIYELKIL